MVAKNNRLHIWVDADACPTFIREIIFRAAIRTHTMTTFVSNHIIYLPSSSFIHRMMVPHGFDEADKKIIDVLEMVGAKVSSGQDKVFVYTLLFLLYELCRYRRYTPIF